MNDLDSTIERIQSSYAAAVYDRDVPAFMRLYDPKVRIFDAWGVWQYEGAEAWQRAIEAWFTSLRSERVRVSFAETQTLGAPDLAFASAIVTYAGLSAQGDELRTMQNRITWCLRRSGHVLRIVHEHTSAPMGFEDMKAILTGAPTR